MSYATYTSDASSFVFGDDPYAPITVPPINHFKAWGVSGEIEWTLADKLSLKSITAYRDYTNQFAEQTDASPVGVQILLQRQFHDQFSQELRLNGAVGYALDYTVGAFYMHQDGGLNARVGLPWVGFDFIHGPDSTKAKTQSRVRRMPNGTSTDKLKICSVACAIPMREDVRLLPSQCRWHGCHPDGIQRSRWPASTERRSDIRGNAHRLSRRHELPVHRQLHGVCVDFHRLQGRRRESTSVLPARRPRSSIRRPSRPTRWARSRTCSTTT